jgi:bacterioferritin (cytochrome b1)
VNYGRWWTNIKGGRRHRDVQKIICDAGEGDTTTAFIFREILEDEEEHHDFFISLKEGKRPVKKK